MPDLSAPVPHQPAREHLSHLDTALPFAQRHIGPRTADVEAMLDRLGLDSLEALMAAAVPGGIRAAGDLDLPAPLTEEATARELRALAAANRPGEPMIGLGYHATVTPPVIRRNVLEDPSWYTAYTPYQPEISQGRLEALHNFQTVVGDLTGLPTANASLLDEGTAAAEAMTLVRRGNRKAAGPFVVDADALPQTIDVVRTRAEAMGIDVVVADLADGLPDGELCGVLVQYPGASGRILDPRGVIEAAHERDALAVVAADLLALTLLEAPGALGADVVVGSTQRFGVPLFYGGPHAGYMAVAAGLERHLPGRLVGVSVDAEGRPAYRLALQTREQHIRRDKATSNICTAQVLLAVVASMYAVYHGPQGLRAIASRTHRYAAVLAQALLKAGIEVEHQQFFDTVSVVVPGRATGVVAAAHERGIQVRQVDTDRVGISTSECTTRSTLVRLLEAFGVDLDVDAVDGAVDDALPAGLRRETAYLTHEVFSSHHSETAMLRYLRRLSARDYALDRGMIPLGSCTMKLNAASEMIPVTWAEFGNLHPFAPAEQSQGYLQMTTELEAMLCAATGYDAVSLQPNAGSQGEYAGLLAIRAYHRSRGEGHRDICLIPSSAHGTNPATAHMAGMRVVVTACDARGNVDVEDLRAKAIEHRERLAAIMITYPSTPGVFEEAIGEICAIIHDNGGQVYIDGANMNAMVGLCAPGKFGGDVSHLNLHKTFCIPHGGGGPGVGPIGVKSHLAPFLPGHAQLENTEGAVCAAPFGSASILPITWMYIRMMGGAGLKRASQMAILNANYIARRLEEHYPVLYTGGNGLVAHECILDLRPLKDTSGISVDDVAKRLIDFGFHAPTMSFPVAGTLMIEPTESESKEELDRFCDAMIQIREEIRAVENGSLDKDDNPLKNAPHTAAELVGEWAHGYSREQAVYPLPSLVEGKYWPPVGRVDNVFGDRNLVCACPSIESYQDA